ncbi:MAG: hypothetical protein AAFY28_05865 [Actinomycetota bacterium]
MNHITITPPSPTALGRPHPSVDSAPSTTPLAPPNRYRLMVLVWLAVWPLITVIGVVTTPLMQSMPIIVRTMATTTVMVPIMVGVLIPTINRRFGTWLRR